MKRGRAEAIVNQVQEVVSHWKSYADEAGVPISVRDQIQSTLWLKIL